MAAMVESVPIARQLRTLSHPSLPAVRRAINAALIRGGVSGLASLWRLLAPNMHQDRALSRRAVEWAALASAHGALTPELEATMVVEKPLKASWWLRGHKGGRVGVTVMLTPEQPPRLQTLQIRSVRAPSQELQAALAAALARLERSDLACIVLPARRVEWVQCASERARNGVALVEGPREMDVCIQIDLGLTGLATGGKPGQVSVTFVPVRKHESLPA